MTSSSEETKALLERIRLGDMDAFGVLSERLRPGLMRHVFKLTGDRSATEAIVQQTMARAIASLPGIRDGTFYFNAWLYTIASNLVRDEGRRNRYIKIYSLEERSLSEDMESIDDYVSSVGIPSMSGSTTAAMDPAALIDGPEPMSEKMTRALSALSPDLRQVLVMRADGYSYQEIAEDLGLDWQIIKSMLEKAKRAMRHSLSV
jgi:RNA polymerase sigma-70 factor (ECF subfamily)